MTCERVFDLAIVFLDGTLGAEARAAVADHLAGCDDCRALIAALREAPPEDPELTAEIVRRTAGSVCESARDRLCAWVDATLDPVETAYVSGHLERCAECAALGRALASMRTELPRLAEIEPDPEFTAAVLARTSLRSRPAPWVERWMASLRLLLDRPRIALEGAFVAAMIVVLPLGALPRRDGARPAEAAVAIRHASGATAARLNVLSRDAWAATRAFVAERSAEIATGIEGVSGTISPSGASSEGSDGTGEIDRKPRSAQEKRR
jgi:anti-sigma factor RsiW